MGVRVQADMFDPSEELRRFAAQGGAGALASFVGWVRGDGGVQSLELEHYPGFTEAEIARLEAEARAKFEVIDTLVIHRIGLMRVGEPIVLAAALGRHRKETLAAVDFLMDHLKTDAPFWKREIGPEGARWVEPTARDRAARAAWDDS